MWKRTAFHAATRRHAAKRRPSRFFIETTGTFVAALCVAFVLENPLGLSHGAEGREMVVSAPAIEVNRALKGDRLIVRPNAGEPPGVQLPRNQTQHLLDGCESASGPILPATEPSRCVT
jgi:hypothetical protein